MRLHLRQKWKHVESFAAGSVGTGPISRGFRSSIGPSRQSQILLAIIDLSAAVMLLISFRLSNLDPTMLSAHLEASAVGALYN